MRLELRISPAAGAWLKRQDEVVAHCRPRLMAGVWAPRPSLLHESQQRGGGGGDFCCPGECRRQPMVRPRTRRSSIASTCPVSAGRPASTRERHCCRRSLRGRLAWREHSGPVVLLLLVQGGCLSRGRASRRRGVCRDLTRLVGLESVL